MKRPYQVWCLSDKIYQWWRWANYSTRERAEAKAAEIMRDQFNGGAQRWIIKTEVRP